MIIRPKPLSFFIILSFCLLCVTGCEAHRPETLVGFAFWFSFVVFALLMVHLAKNTKYYDKYFDDDELD